MGLETGVLTSRSVHSELPLNTYLLPVFTFLLSSRKQPYPG